MKALISGSAGRAFILDRGSWSVATWPEDGEQQAVAPRHVRMMVDRSSLLEEIEVDAYEDVRIKLRDAWHRDRAVQLMMIFLDHAYPDNLRQEAASAAEETICNEAIFESTANVLYSSPLPTDTDFASWLFVLGDLDSFKNVGRIIEKLHEDQPVIHSVRDALMNTAKRYLVVPA